MQKIKNLIALTVSLKNFAHIKIKVYFFFLMIKSLISKLYLCVIIWILLDESMK